MRTTRFRWTPRTVSVAALSALALLCGGYVGESGTYAAPAPPPAVCGLVRPAIVDILLPGHGAPVAGRTSTAYYRASTCVVESGDVYLGVTLLHVGRGPAGGPVRQADAIIATQFARLRNPYGPPREFDLGDHAAYQVLDDEPGSVEVWLNARVGSFVFLGAYSGPGLTTDSAREALATLAEEVLSQT